MRILMLLAFSFFVCPASQAQTATKHTRIVAVEIECQCGSPNQVERDISLPLEREFSKFLGVERMNSVSGEGGQYRMELKFVRIPTAAVRENVEQSVKVILQNVAVRTTKVVVTIQNSILQ